MLPNSGQAVIDPAKVRDYLLSSGHPVGRFKAVFFGSLGYNGQNWQLLADDLLALARTWPALPGQPSAFGQKFEISGTLLGPNGRRAAITTVWLIATAESSPRFVTAFPG